MKKIIRSFFDVRSPFLWFALAIGLLLFCKELLISKLILFSWMLTYVGLLFEKTWVNNHESSTLLLDALLTPYHKKRTLISYSVLLAVLYSCLSIVMMFAYITLYNQEALTSNLPFKSLGFEDYAASIIMTVLLTTISISNHFIKRSYAKFIFNVANILLFLCYALNLNSSVVLNDLGVLTVNTAGLSIFMALVHNAKHKTKKKAKTEKSQTKETDFVVGNNIKGILTLSKMNIVAESEILNSAWTGVTSFSTYFLIRTILNMIEKGTVTSDFMTNWIFILVLLCVISALNSTRKITQIYNSKNMLKVVPVHPDQLFKACVLSSLTPVVISQGIAVVLMMLLLKHIDPSEFFMTSHPLEQIVQLMAIAVFPISTFMICLKVHFSKDRTLTKIILIAIALTTIVMYLGLRSILETALPLKIIILILAGFVPYLVVSTPTQNIQNLHSGG